MVRNMTTNVPDLNELHEDGQWARVSELNMHYAERMASIANKGIHLKRGIKTTGLESTTIPKTIARRNWFRFTIPPWNYHPGLVREFYAAMVSEVFKAHGTVWVRETQIQITPEAINAYLGTPDIPACTRNGGLPVDLIEQYWGLVEALAASLRRDGRNVWGPDEAMLQHGDLHPEMAFWTVFLNYNLIASHHRTNVSFDTTQVLYAIQHDRQFDVGQL